MAQEWPGSLGRMALFHYHSGLISVQSGEKWCGSIPPQLALCLMNFKLADSKSLNLAGLLEYFAVASWTFQALLVPRLPTTAPITMAH
jgi:hypothetical protein